MNYFRLTLDFLVELSQTDCHSHGKAVSIGSSRALKGRVARWRAMHASTHSAFPGFPACYILWEYRGFRTGPLFMSRF